MKYRVGDTVYFENGFNVTIQAYDIFSDGNHYFFIGANGMERVEINLIDKHTCSEKEWKEKQERESFKFKNGHNQYIPSYYQKYFYADICDENLFGVATWLNDATDMHRLKLGLIKETPQECVKLAKEMLKKLELEV